MLSTNIPFSNGYLKVDLSEENLLYVIKPKHTGINTNPLELIKHAIRNPIGTKNLKNIARVKNAKTAAIVVTDITRPSPDHLFLPAILEELEEAGIKKDNIKIIVALGMHRPCTQEELKDKFGEEIFNKYTIVNSEPSNNKKLTFLGKTSYDCPVWINSDVVEADLVVSTGIIEPHLWAGYSGGRKSVAIGVASEETIKFQHHLSIFDDETVRIGNIKGNKFHENAMEIAKMAQLDFIVNAILNEKGEIIKVVAGDSVLALEEGVGFSDEIFNIEIEEQADIVIAGVPIPKDSNLYQATRGASYIKFSPYPSVKEGGLIIMPAKTIEGAGEGLGEKRYLSITSQYKSVDELIEGVTGNSLAAGGHKAYLMALTLKYANVAIVGSETPEIVEKLFMQNYASIEDALEAGFKKYGKNAKVTIIPDSFHVLTSKRSD